ncbi:DUF4440 domain-containing protein [Bradyrhizobium sp. AC87j1]|uniref:YybH family protein n=1 Tax=Bradyrhizobium sp. AC87j1 TaxID=2055894 RepID=UPI001FE23F78|nr:DUF4440 domain-containing protein [Bradyrhizobium sp. AC87j1]
MEAASGRARQGRRARLVKRSSRDMEYSSGQLPVNFYCEASSMVLTVILRNCRCVCPGLGWAIQRIYFETRRLPLCLYRTLSLEMIMRNIASAIAIVISLSAPALAQKAEIEANNAKWIEMFNKGDFSGIASLYSADATALPPGSAMVQGRPAIEVMWKSMAEQVTDPKLTTVDVKPLGSSAAREIGTFVLKTKGSTPQDVTGKYVVVWEKVGDDWKLATDIWNDGK